MEVFPALALPSLEPAFCGRLLGPHYNPARSKTFALTGWHAVIAAVRRIADEEAFEGLREWTDATAEIPVPKKSDQDRLDAVLCALIGLHWHTASRDASIMLGDRSSGYMISRAKPDVRARLAAVAEKTGVRLMWISMIAPNRSSQHVAPRRTSGTFRAPQTRHSAITTRAARHVSNV